MQTVWQERRIDWMLTGIHQTGRKMQQSLNLTVVKMVKYCFAFLVAAAIFLFLSFLLFESESRSLVVSMTLESFTVGTSRVEKIPTEDESPSIGIHQYIMRLFNISNLPLVYSPKYDKKVESDKNKTCVKFPHLTDIQFSNTQWQMMKGPNYRLYLYNSYFDRRPKAGPTPLVRIIATSNDLNLTDLFCHLWYKESQVPFSTPAIIFYAWQRAWGFQSEAFMHPYIISCNVSKWDNETIPSSVSITSDPCGMPTTNLRVKYAVPNTMQNIGTCVRSLYLLKTDFSLRLVELAEMLRLLGVRKIFLYNTESHPNVTRILDYYQKTGLMDVRPITYPGGPINLPGFNDMYHNWLWDITQYNDCLYRNLYSFKYLIVQDLDEFILPIVHYTYDELIANITGNRSNFRDEFSSLSVRNALYSSLNSVDGNERQSEIPKYMFQLKHVYRKNFSHPKDTPKAFHNVQKVFALHNHFPRECFQGCKNYFIQSDLAHLKHQRYYCPGRKDQTCQKAYTIKDVSVWRYRTDLVSRVNKTLKQLGLL